MTMWTDLVVRMPVNCRPNENDYIRTTEDGKVFAFARNYEVSNENGQIRNKTTKVVLKTKEKLGKSPYKLTTVYTRDAENNLIKMTKAVHILVKDSFEPNGYEPSLTVDHFDQNCHNNNHENLLFSTMSDNIRNQFGTRTHKKDDTPRGIHRITEHDVFKRFKTKRFDMANNLVQRSFSVKTYGTEDIALMHAVCWRGLGQFIHTN